MQVSIKAASELLPDRFVFATARQVNWMRTAAFKSKKCLTSSRAAALTQTRAAAGAAATAAVQQQRGMATVRALKGHIPGFRERVSEVNNGLDEANKLVPFCVGGQRLGYIKQE
jgi:hypothetical protein